MSTFIPHPKRENEFLFKYALNTLHLSRMLNLVLQTYKVNNDGELLDLEIEQDSDGFVLNDSQGVSHACFYSYYFTTSKNWVKLWSMQVDHGLHDLLDSMPDLMTRVESDPGEQLESINIDLL